MIMIATLLLCQPRLQVVVIAPRQDLLSHVLQNSKRALSLATVDTKNLHDPKCPYTLGIMVLLYSI